MAGFFGGIKMLMKVCRQCGRRLPQGQRCQCRTARHKLYNETQRDKERNEFYHSQAWRRLTLSVKARANGLDEYALAEGRIEQGNTAHHIYTLAERPDLKLSLDNLIWVSARTHGQIHAEYERGAEVRRGLQEKLAAIAHGGG